MSKYKQSYILVMESGKIVKWTGYAEDILDAKGKAVSYAKNKTGEQVWDLCCRPVHTL